jgi:ribosomal protein S18 acetylase RimI-like enzyme
VTAQAKAHSYRFRDGVVRVATWHGKPDVATIAVRAADTPSPRTLDRLLDRLRDAGYRQVLTNAVGPGTSVWLVDSGFAVRGRLHLLEHALDDLPKPSRRTRRAARADRDAIVAVDAASFDDFWRFDELALREAMRATPRAHTRVAALKGTVVGYGLFGRAGTTGYVQRLAVGPEGQGHGLGRALLFDGLRWLHVHGATRALVNTQEDNERALDLYVRAGFTRCPVGLCVLGRDL